MEYLSPGVYVEEVPSAVQPIAGVGTSTAGFIGVVPDSLIIPQRRITGKPNGVRVVRQPPLTWLWYWTGGVICVSGGRCASWSHARQH